ncbi:MAG: IS1182 family transposase [Ardenticatenaceae bacterium]|nr:IS1182 family transposase [Ardenticatenaceae bacterium]
MSLKLNQETSIPAETVRAARAAFPKGNVYMRIRDELGVLDEDQAFADLDRRYGAPAESAAALALVSVMQYMENLDDRHAAEAVRARLDWKYALGLELEDSGFDHTVLSQFRTRLLTGGAEERVFEGLVEHLVARGLIRSRGKQRSDSTQVLARIRVLNRLELVGETMRAALNALAAIVPTWLQAWVPAPWYDRYERRVEQYRLPSSAAEQAAWALQVGADGQALWEQLMQPEVPLWWRQVPAVDALRQVWRQQDWVNDGHLCWREADLRPPAGVLIQSPSDLEAHSSQKRGAPWVGSKVQVTESCDDDLPARLTTITTTPSAWRDHQGLPAIHETLAAQPLLPAEHLVDAGDRDADGIVTAQQQPVTLVGPVPGDSSWQAHAGRGCDLGAFAIDWEAPVAPCPQGHHSRLWSATDAPDAPINVACDRHDGTPCPCRPDGTRATTGPRTLKLRPRAQHEILQHVRQAQATPAFQEAYAARAAVEATISQGVRGFGLRRARYLGQATTHLQHGFTAAAINLTRLADWWDQQQRPRPKRPPARFAALAPAAAAAGFP